MLEAHQPAVSYLPGEACYLELQLPAAQGRGCREQEALAVPALPWGARS